MKKQFLLAVLNLFCLVAMAQTVYKDQYGNVIGTVGKDGNIYDRNGTLSGQVRTNNGTVTITNRLGGVVGTVSPSEEERFQRTLQKLNEDSNRIITGISSQNSLGTQPINIIQQQPIPVYGPRPTRHIPTIVQPGDLGINIVTDALKNAQFFDGNSFPESKTIIRTEFDKTQEAWEKKHNDEKLGKEGTSAYLNTYGTTISPYVVVWDNYDKVEGKIIGHISLNKKLYIGHIYHTKYGDMVSTKVKIKGHKKVYISVSDVKLD